MFVVELAGEPAGYSGKVVLEDVHLRIDAGERIAIVGESGSGKTTLLKLIEKRSAVPVALVPQDLGLVRALTVFHNVYMGRLNAHSALYNLRNLVWPARREVAEIRAVLEPLRLTDKIFTPVGQLSGGQQQRTAVARALYSTGELFVGDEPVSAVDDHQARELLGIAGREKQTVVVALHDRALALSFASRIIGLRNGAIVLDSPAAGLLPGDLDHLYLT